MVEWMRSRSSGPVHNRQVSPVASEGLRREVKAALDVFEEAAFSVMEKLVRAATNSSRQDNFQNAATHLRRAHQIASKHASDGLLAGRVARATIGVQYCALLSHAARHSQALNEALAAVVEAEEVWCLVRSSSEASTQLTRRSVC
ncbi:unnamed protein product, partial [Symbiodinium sp. CCMP2456]